MPTNETTALPKMVRLISLQYWHSFRPPNELAIFVSPSDIVSLRDVPYDEHRRETVSELVMKDGSTYTIKGNADAIAAQLGVA